MRTKMPEEERLLRARAACARSYVRHREERLQKARERYAANAEAEKARHKEWATANVEHLRDYNRRRYWTNPEPKKAQVKAWRDRNPEYSPLACLQYQIRKHLS